MADPITIIRTLDAFPSGHKVFQKDQVLTAGQLNGLADYLEGQERLSRVELMGIGIIGGLWPRIETGQVTIGKGVGVTSNGDLLVLAEDAVCDRYKKYDETAPAYPPFYTPWDDDPTKRGPMIPVFELVRQKAEDEEAQNLSTLPDSLSSYVVVLLMESTLKDPGLCSGANCDNLGKDAVNTLRLLLIPRQDAEKLPQNLPATDAEAAGKLPALAADRVQLFGPASIQTLDLLASCYRLACDNIQLKLRDSLIQLNIRLPGLVAEVFGTDPTSAWMLALNNAQKAFAGKNLGIQYYYDFLKDVVETWNALRDCLLEDDSVLCPDFAAFPKHLLLGELSDPRNLRAGLYPSPLIVSQGRLRGHGRFLAAKLDFLITNYNPPVPGKDEIRITPSNDERTPLETRAIPYYYPPPVYRVWNYRLSRTGQANTNLGYHAAGFTGGSAAADPYASQIGRYDFFRIEGHLGQDIENAVTRLRNLIAAKNLPIAVRAVLLHQDSGHLTLKPPVRFSDLHRLHYVLRNELHSQLARSGAFSQSMLEKVQNAVAHKTIPDQLDLGRDTSETAKDFDNDLQATVAAVSHTLTNPRYSAYRADTGWKAQYHTAVDRAGQFKQTFGPMLRADFTTAFDTLIADNHAQWMGWLETMIEDKGQREDEKLLFANFLRDHPGLEHWGGVERGGTFVLVYDDGRKVVADFALPYHAEEVYESEPALPSLPANTLKPSYVYTGGYQLVKPLETTLDARLAEVKQGMQAEWKNDVTVQQDYFKFLISTVGSLSQLSSQPGIAKETPAYADAPLASKVKAVELSSQLLENLQQSLVQSASEEIRSADMHQRLQQAEQVLAQSIIDVATHIAKAGFDVSPGTEGGRAMAIVAGNTGKVATPEAGKQLLEGLNKVSQMATGKGNLSQFITNLVQFHQ